MNLLSKDRKCSGNYQKVNSRNKDKLIRYDNNYKINYMKTH